jgi:pimeloyl-ACP methyl ester carboxylesterase
MATRLDDSLPQQQRYDLGRVRLHVLRWDATASPCPLVVLLHGLSGTAQTAWTGVARHIRRRRPQLTIYAPDLRGHGHSDWPPTGYRAEDVAADIVAFLERLPGAAATRWALLPACSRRLTGRSSCSRWCW